MSPRVHFLGSGPSLSLPGSQVVAPPPLPPPPATQQETATWRLGTTAGTHSGTVCVRMYHACAAPACAERTHRGLLPGSRHALWVARQGVKNRARADPRARTHAHARTCRGALGRNFTAAAPAVHGAAVLPGCLLSTVWIGAPSLQNSQLGQPVFLQIVYTQIEEIFLSLKFRTFHAGHKRARSGSDFLPTCAKPTYWFLPHSTLFAFSLLSEELQPSGTD